MLMLGAHISAAKGVDKAPGRCVEFQIKAMQIFTKNQNRWKAKELKSKTIENYKKNIEKFGIKTVLSHSSYLINLASIDEVKYKKSCDSFADELNRCSVLKIPYLVLHPGSHLGNGETSAISRIAETLDMMFEVTNDEQTTVLLETTAGQGTNVGYKFEHLRDIIAKSKYPERLAVCFDTCHVFAAGYDFRTEFDYLDMKTQFDSIIGLSRLKAFHFNDSKRAFASKKDRHEEIGMGEIGLDAFGFFINDHEFDNIPAILETPGGATTYNENLTKLRMLAK